MYVTQCEGLLSKWIWYLHFFFSISAKAPEDSKCWQPTVIFIRSTNHKWPYKLSLTIHFHQSYHFSLTFTIVITLSCSYAVRRSRFTSCVIGEGHQNQKVQRPSRWVSNSSHSFEIWIHLKLRNGSIGFYWSHFLFDLGLTVEAVDKGANGCIVKGMNHSGAFSKDGRVQQGDYIVAINNESMRRITNAQARAIIRRASLQGLDVRYRAVTLQRILI